MPSYDWRRLGWDLRYRRGAWIASEMRRLMILATHRHCHVEFQGPVYLGPGFSLFIPDNGTLIVGAGCQFRRGFYCEISGDGRVEIGAGSVFTYGSIIQCSTVIKIGERCSFGQSILVDGNHRFRDTTRPMLEQGFDFTPVHFGDDVTITSNCTVMADIGDHSFVAANSVVSRPIPAYCLAAGAPARVIDYYGPPERRPPDLGA
jgi:acetyltransferase-like isoleucine patch superfamily enzyme